MQLSFQTGKIELIESNIAALPITLNELRSLYFDPDFQEPIEIDLILSLEEERFLFTTQFLIMHATHIDALKRITRDLGIRLTYKDTKAGSKRILSRLMEQLEKPEVLEQFQQIARANHLKHAMIQTVKTMSCDDDEYWQQLKRDMAAMFVRVDGIQKDAEKRWEVIAKELDGQEQNVIDNAKKLFLKELEHFLILPAAIGLSFFSSDVFTYWRTWVQNDSSTLESSYDLRLVEMINDWLSVVGKKRSQNPAAELERLKQRQREMELQHQADLEYLQSTLLEWQERARKAERGEIASSSAKGALLGKRILVVGDDSHMAAYRQAVQQYGADFDFVSGFDKNAQAISRFGWADGIILITAYAEHAKWYALKARVSMDRLALVNRAGVAAMEEGLKLLVTKLNKKVSA